MMRRCQESWGIAGGRAIELFVDARLRRHADELCVARRIVILSVLDRPEPMSSTPKLRISQLGPAILLAGYIVLFIWGAINPYDRADWWAENLPIVALVTTLVVLYARGVRFSTLAYLLMAFIPYWNTIGGHYTFERVPFGWFDRAFGFQRNMFDRVGHFSVGFFAFAILEYLLSRNAMSRRLACLFAIFAIGFVAMSYELLEWLYAAYGGNAAAGANFLGSQGDVWDAQKDMLMDTIGAVVTVLLFLGVRSAGWRPVPVRRGATAE